MDSNTIIEQLKTLLETEKSLNSNQQHTIQLAILELQKDETIERWVKAIELVSSLLTIGSNFIQT